MEYQIRRAQPGDEAALAYIQTESWKAGFQDILPPDTLARFTQLDRVTAMYHRSLAPDQGNGYLLFVDGEPHCIAWWDKSREEDMPEYAELICLHSLPNRWRQGFGSKMMDAVLRDIREAGYSKVMLWVFTENPRARRFYEAHGFTPNGKIKTGFDAEEICYERML